MTRKEKLMSLLNDLLEKVDEVKDYIIYEYDEDEREEEELKEYLELLYYIEDVIN